MISKQVKIPKRCGEEESLIHGQVAIKIGKKYGFDIPKYRDLVPMKLHKDTHAHVSCNISIIIYHRINFYLTSIKPQNETILFPSYRENYICPKIQEILMNLLKKVTK